MVRFGWLLAAAAMGWVASLSTSASVQQGGGAKPPTEQPAAKNAGDLSAEEEDALAQTGEETLERVCIQCHSSEVITRTRRLGSDWNEVVTTMANQGAIGTDGQFATLEQYLTRYYGLVNVNTASAEELSAVLGLSRKDAAAVVEYRNVHGKFADGASLLKVEGVNTSKIEAQLKALRFDGA